ncbi:hypothetical protein [Streptacidiphilus sp. MAP12-16]|uniref:hypothetical protein n=1 Tax=Streptacidiphilus sp. MAP12-16 TaxID=3156300 RepID=UPI0035143CD4
MTLAVATVSTAVLATGCASTHAFYGVRAVPPTPSVVATGSAYPYYLYIHCGIRFAHFAGRWWQADAPGPAPTAAGANTEAYGSMELIDANHARFLGDGVPTVDFHPYTGTPPACS